MPESLMGAELQFRFESPLHDAIEQAKSATFQEAQAITANVITLDPSAVSVVDWKTAFRDVLNGIGAPAKWLNSEEQVAQADMAQRQQAQTQALLGNLQQGADVAKTIKEAQALGVAA
jgi:hypothetical protein